jgi:hypothetical protein
MEVLYICNTFLCFYLYKTVDFVQIGFFLKTLDDPNDFFLLKTLDKQSPGRKKARSQNKNKRS